MSLHYIILSSSYSLGTRICFDIVDDVAQANSAVLKIKDGCGYDVSLSYHVVKTDSPAWPSVTAKDAFFSHVKRIETLDYFIELIKKDRSLSAMDVAKYIVNIVPCSNLKLQKLLYLSYADYLVSSKRRLFEGESICALQYGPIVSSVLDYFKGCRELLNINDFEDPSTIPQEERLRLPARSRILFAEEGNAKIVSIDKTLRKYGGMHQSQLIELTHGENTPWYIAKEEGRHIISDTIILKYHCNEC